MWSDLIIAGGKYIELFGLCFAIPVTLITATIYCVGTAVILTKRPNFRLGMLVGSVVVGFCILMEFFLLGLLGTKEAYSSLGIGFTVVHEVSFWLGPPAIANLLLLLLRIRSTPWNLLKMSVACLICWFACIGALFGNIAVDEAIVGVDAGVPYFMQKTQNHAPSNLTQT